jgi:transposase
VPGAPEAPVEPQETTLRAAAEQDRAEIIQERADYLAKVGQRDPAQLVFLDESGVTTKMTRRRARAPQGRRALGPVPFGWERLTLLGALVGREGMVASMSIKAATSTPVFLAFLEQVLLVPALVERQPGATVIIGNLRAHHAPAVEPLLKAAGPQLLHLPRYSPDLPPIEPGGAKLKEQLRAKAGRDLPSLEAELGPAFAAITPQDVRGWSRRCGYAAQPT